MQNHSLFVGCLLLSIVPVTFICTKAGEINSQSFVLNYLCYTVAIKYSLIVFEQCSYLV